MLSVGITANFKSIFPFVVVQVSLLAFKLII